MGNITNDTSHGALQFRIIHTHSVILAILCCHSAKICEQQQHTRISNEKLSIVCAILFYFSQIKEYPYPNFKPYEVEFSKEFLYFNINKKNTIIRVYKNPICF